MTSENIEKKSEKVIRKCINCSWSGLEEETKGRLHHCPKCGDSTENKAEMEARIKKQKEAALEFFQKGLWKTESNRGLVKAVLDTELVPEGDRIMSDMYSVDNEYLITEILKPFKSKPDIVRVKLGKTSYIDFTREQVEAITAVLGKSAAEIAEARRIANDPDCRPDSVFNKKPKDFGDIAGETG